MRLVTVKSHGQTKKTPMQNFGTVLTITFFAIHKISGLQNP